MIDMVEVVYEWSACSDCVAEVANGESGRTVDPQGGDRELCAAADAFVAARYAEGVHVVNGDEDYGFSWTRCEVCGDTRGGDREQVVGLR